MPIYSFAIARSEGEPLFVEHLEMEGPDEACKEAVSAAGEMIKDLGISLCRGQELRLQVTDESQTSICRLHIRSER